MHTKIIDLINILVKMSGEKENIKSLNEEILHLDNLLPELKKDLESLTVSISDDKYFDAASEIIDRNIELSLKKKINSLQLDLKKEAEKIEIASKKSKEANSKYDLLNKRLSSCESFITILNNHIQNENDSSEESKYYNLLEQEKKRYESLNEEINECTEIKEKLLIELDELEKSKEGIETSLNNEKKQLEEIKENLANKTSYIDQQRKEEDLNKVSELKNKIENTEKRKTEIISTITYKAEASKELLLDPNEDKNAFLLSINEITNMLNNIPYLKIEDEMILKEESHQLESKKDELTTLIENKKYASNDLSVIETRLEYLENKKNLINKQMNLYSILGNSIDNEEIIKVGDILSELREQVKSYDIINEKDDTLENYNLLNDLITNYEEDLQELIIMSNAINNEYLVICQNQIDDIEKEKEYLNKKKILHRDSINLVEKEKDKKALKDLVDNLDKLNARLNIGMTPNQVLDQIEMLLFAGEEAKEEPVIEDYTPKDENPETPVTKRPIFQNIEVIDSSNNAVVEPDYTFERLSEDHTPVLEEEIPEEMIINPLEPNPEIFNQQNEADDIQDYSFSPLDNTGFMSFDDALNIAKNNE